MIMYQRLIPLFISLFAFIGLFGQISDTSLYISHIKVEGNKKTKEFIVLRELMVEPGKSYSTDEMHGLLILSRQNLINTSLFHTADLNLVPTQDSGFQLLVKLVERWYLWPVPQIDIDERNFNVWWEHKRLDRLSAGIDLTQTNFRGRQEQLSLIIMTGYNQQYGINYLIPYFNKSKSLGLGFNALWSGRHEVIAMTFDDKQVFYKDVNHYVRKEFKTGFYLQYRRNYFTTHHLELSLQNDQLSQGLLDSAENYSFKKKSNLSFFNIYYKLKIDRRDFKIYPLKGYYADIEVYKHGLGIMPNGGMNLWDLKTTLRKYWQLNDRFFFAAGGIGKISNYGATPYLLQKSLGYGRDFVRGYEYYVIDGRYYGVAKTNIKYAIFKDKVLKINKIKTEKFNTIPWAVYVNLFADAGSVSSDNDKNATNQLPGTFLGSVGLGLDFTTYYDRVARIEIARNKSGETGFFLHFIAPI
ncbi:MAG: hypothetical protein JXR34_00475 [Bacteroidales bacterium]|nr:hypothetical protein [Bacteroidales bacterium]